MSKPFNIHDWQLKQKRLAEADNPAFKINPSNVPGTAAWGGRAGLTVGGSDDSVSGSDLRGELERWTGGIDNNKFTKDIKKYSKKLRKKLEKELNESESQKHN